MSNLQPGSIREALPQAPPDSPEPFEAVIADLDELILPGVTHWNHPDYFAYFP
jgi:aromatic-L-amino-acid decarboxylase